MLPPNTYNISASRQVTYIYTPCRDCLETELRQQSSCISMAIMFCIVKSIGTHSSKQTRVPNQYATSMMFLRVLLVAAWVSSIVDSRPSTFDIRLIMAPKQRPSIGTRRPAPASVSLATALSPDDLHRLVKGARTKTSVACTCYIICCHTLV